MSIMLDTLRLPCLLLPWVFVVCSATKPNIIFNPPNVDKIETRSIRRVNWTFEDNATFPANGVYYNIDYEVLNRRVFNVSTSDYETPCLTSGNDDVFSFDVKGMLLGYGTLRMNFEAFDCQTNLKMQNYSFGNDYQVSVVRAYSTVKNIFTWTLAVAVTINYVNMGCQLDLGAILKVLKSPIGPIIGICCQFIIMPLGSYGYGLLLFDDLSLRLGLFTLGCSPGGTVSNFWTLLFNGDLNLSITMTFMSTIVALGMMPMWFYTLGAKLFHDGKATLPYGKLATSLVTLTAPLVIGILIRRFKPEVAKFSSKIIRPFTMVTMVVIISLGIYANRYIFLLFTGRIVAAGLCVAATGYLLGGLAAWVFCLNKAQIITVAIETAFQNSGIAFIILTLSLPQPDADLTAIPIFAQLMLTALPMWFALIVIKIWKCVNKSESYSISECEKDTESIQVKEIEDKKLILKY